VLHVILCDVCYCIVLYCTLLYYPVLHCNTLPPGINPLAVKKIKIIVGLKSQSLQLGEKATLASLG
jgi:hypothetical protein